jgi:hypothetical protein
MFQRSYSVIQQIPCLLLNPKVHFDIHKSLPLSLIHDGVITFFLALTDVISSSTYRKSHASNRGMLKITVPYLKRSAFHKVHIEEILGTYYC